MSFVLHGNQLHLDGRRIGWITRTMNGKRVYVSPRNRMGITKTGKGHFMEIFQSYGIANSVLKFLERNQIDEVHLRIGKSETLISKVSDWREKGFLYHRPPYEEQIMLKEEDMTRKILTLAELTL